MISNCNRSPPTATSRPSTATTAIGTGRPASTSSGASIRNRNAFRPIVTGSSARAASNSSLPPNPTDTTTSPDPCNANVAPNRPSAPLATSTRAPAAAITTGDPATGIPRLSRNDPSTRTSCPRALACKASNIVRART